MRLRLEMPAVRVCHPEPFFSRGAVGLGGVAPWRQPSFQRHLLVRSYLFQSLARGSWKG